MTFVNRRHVDTFFWIAKSWGQWCSFSCFCCQYIWVDSDDDHLTYTPMKLHSKSAFCWYSGDFYFCSKTWQRLFHWFPFFSSCRPILRRKRRSFVRRWPTRLTRDNHRWTQNLVEYLTAKYQHGGGTKTWNGRTHLKVRTLNLYYLMNASLTGSPKPHWETNLVPQKLREKEQLEDEFECRKVSPLTQTLEQPLFMLNATFF